MIREIKAAYNINDDPILPQLVPRFLPLSNQKHNGCVNKHEEPFMTLLRAKPRERKVKYERFIILDDADPRHIEERFGGELMSKQLISKLVWLTNIEPSD